MRSTTREHTINPPTRDPVTPWDHTTPWEPATRDPEPVTTTTRDPIPRPCSGTNETKGPRRFES